MPATSRKINFKADFKADSKTERQPNGRRDRPRDWTEYGGELRKTREGRKTKRPLSYRQTMHVVLRSSKAKGEWSFRKARHRKNILRLVEKFSVMYDVQILSMANVGNHLHLHVKLMRREAYIAFIRAVSGAIVMTVTGVSRWTKRTAEKSKFWDHRPYSRIVLSLRHFLNLKDYVAENQLEGQGISRSLTWLIVEAERDRHGNPANFL